MLAPFIFSKNKRHFLSFSTYFFAHAKSLRFVFVGIMNSDSDSDENDCYCVDSEVFNLNNNLYEVEIEDDYYAFEVVSASEVVEEMLKTIRDVNAIVQMQPTYIRILLNYFNWDKDKLFESYYGGDPESLFKDAHITNVKSSLGRFQLDSPKVPVDVCEICYDNYPPEFMTSLSCGHHYCTECWIHYLTTKIVDESEFEIISCIDHTCDTLVDDNTILALVDADVKTRYQYLITNNFISCNRHLRHCPNPGCDKIVKVQFVDARNVTCSCGHTFCFVCCEDGHEPITCVLFKRWQARCNDDDSNLTWIVKNSKLCPKCQVPIEKNGGCNHMTCKNPSCGHEFCWLCLKDWRMHNSRDCSTFSVQVDEKKSKIEISVEKFKFCGDRYRAHYNSLKFERQLKSADQMLRKVAVYEACTSVLQTQFLPLAVEVLCKCRRALMNTYIFAYFIEKNQHLDIFEENQKDLQDAIEDLSNYLSRETLANSLNDYKHAIQNKFKYCDRRRKVLLDHIQEGHDRKFWEFHDL